MFGRFTIVARNFWEAIVFIQKNVLCKQTPSIFSKKNAFLPVPKESDRLYKPLLKNSFSTNFQCTGHERVQFTLVGLFSGFTIAANFSRADCSKLFQSGTLQPRKKRRPFPQAIAKFKAQSFPKRIRPLIKPLLGNRFYTNFQCTGPWEGPIHFSRFVLRVHNCSKLFQSWSLAPREERKAFYKSNLFFIFPFLFSFLFLLSFLFLFLFLFPFLFLFLFLFLFFFLFLSLSFLFLSSISHYFFRLTYYAGHAKKTPS